MRLCRPYAVTSLSLNRAQAALVFDVGVYLVVIGLVLDVLRSLGAEVDRQTQELRDTSSATGSSRQSRVSA